MCWLSGEHRRGRKRTLHEGHHIHERGAVVALRVGVFLDEQCVVRLCVVVPLVAVHQQNVGCVPRQGRQALRKHQVCLAYICKQGLIVCTARSTHNLRLAVHDIHVVAREGAHGQLPSSAQHLRVLQQLVRNTVGVTHALLRALFCPEKGGHLLVLQGLEQCADCGAAHVPVPVLALQKRNA